MPAREQIAANDARTPGPASLGPNIVPTHAVKYTASMVSVVVAVVARSAGTVVTAGVAATSCDAASACTAPFRLALDCPPPGNSGDHSGNVSGSITLRPSRFGPLTKPEGSLPAVVRATAAARVVPAQCFAASCQPFCAVFPALSARSRFIRSPVLIVTGHAVWHIPSTAQVSTASYSYSFSNCATSAMSP